MSFSQYSVEDKSYLQPFLEEVQLKKGEILFSPGKRADGVFYIVKGRLGVQTFTGFEKKTQVVALLDPGAPVGEKALSTVGVRGMTVTAIEDSTLSYLSHDNFLKLEKEHPTLAIRLLKHLLRTSSLRLEANSIRLAHVL